MEQTPILELTSADTSVAVAPGQGAGILHYRTTLAGSTYDWLQAPQPGLPACFAMLPYCSRIRAGRFEFAGRSIHLPANNPPEPHSIHGHGWQTAWQVRSVESGMVELGYLHAADSWPWRYRATQRLVLTGSVLRITLGIENLADSPMPAGMGLHPYFASTRRAHLSMQVSAIWTLDQELLSPHRRQLPAAGDRDTRLALGDTSIDRVYSGRRGTLTLTLPERNARIDIDADDVFSHLIVFARSGEAFACVEPVSNVADAFNLDRRREGDDVFQVIASGETLTGSITIAPSIAQAPH